MIDTAVILAAGKGERLNDISNFKSKPLTEIFGISLIERNICKLNECLLVKNFIVVTGFNYKELENHLDEIKQRRNLNIKAIFDKDWEKGNGRTFLTGLNSESNAINPKGASSILFLSAGRNPLPTFAISSM